MWFKNLYLFKLNGEFTLSAEELHEELGKKIFAPCSAGQRESSGWVSPLGKNSESLSHAANGYILITMARQEKILPSSVIREELEERVETIQNNENRKVSNNEKKDLREEIEFELLPRAFARTQKFDAWIDPRGQWVVVNTSSPARAEALTELLRESIGSLPTALPETEVPAILAMTQWLKEEKAPAPFVLGSECELKSQDEDKSVATFRKHELTADEIHSNLDTGKLATKLALEWDEKIGFVLTEDFQIKKLKFLDILAEKLDEEDPQSHEEHIDIEFALMTGEVSRLLIDLMKVLEK
ncbi:MAG TPA: recombination-associated protein RdgC [Leucothrix mucor]|nr:recombination-associated protein RdgC [Leucothrix mucor]